MLADSPVVLIKKNPASAQTNLECHHKTLRCATYHQVCGWGWACPPPPTGYQDDLGPLWVAAGPSWGSRCSAGPQQTCPPPAPQFHCQSQTPPQESDNIEDRQWRPGPNNRKYFHKLSMADLDPGGGGLGSRHGGDVDLIVWVCLRGLALHHDLVPTGHGSTCRGSNHSFTLVHWLTCNYQNHTRVVVETRRLSTQRQITNTRKQ